MLVPGNFLIGVISTAELAFGSVVTMKNHRPGGALLHSHSHLYPKEHPPEQQQVNQSTVEVAGGRGGGGGGKDGGTSAYLGPRSLTTSLILN